MPNHVTNIVKMKGITTLPLFTNTPWYGGENVMAFDFNKVIPMPKSLDMVSGSMENLAIEAALRNDAVLRKQFVQKYSAPCINEKAYLEGIAYSDKTEHELCEIGLQYINNLQLYGFTTWYGWCNEFWGTKWNAYENEQIDRDTIMFKTAWAAPEKVIAQLARMYPDAEIEHWWADEDMGYNTGHTKYNGGEVEDVDYYDDCSNQAYETYILCWGESECLYQDEKGIWRHKNCDECQKC